MARRPANRDIPIPTPDLTRKEAWDLADAINLLFAKRGHPMPVVEVYVTDSKFWGVREIPVELPR